MPRPFSSFHSTTPVADVVLVAATETVIATLGGISVDDPNEIVSLYGTAEVTTVAGATTHTLRLRRNNLAGALVGEANPITTAAVANVLLLKRGDDVPGDVASQTYVLTVISAVGASTVLSASLDATVHTP